LGARLLQQVRLGLVLGSPWWVNDFIEGGLSYQAERK